MSLKLILYHLYLIMVICFFEVQSRDNQNCESVKGNRNIYLENAERYQNTTIQALETDERKNLLVMSVVEEDYPELLTQEDTKRQRELQSETAQIREGLNQRNSTDPHISQSRDFFIQRLQVFVDHLSVRRLKYGKIIQSEELKFVNDVIKFLDDDFRKSEDLARENGTSIVDFTKLQNLESQSNTNATLDRSAAYGKIDKIEEEIRNEMSSIIKYYEKPGNRYSIINRGHADSVKKAKAQVIEFLEMIPTEKARVLYQQIYDIEADVDKNLRIISIVQTNHPKLRTLENIIKDKKLLDEVTEVRKKLKQSNLNRAQRLENRDLLIKRLHELNDQLSLRISNYEKIIVNEESSYIQEIIPILDDFRVSEDLERTKGKSLVDLEKLKNFKAPNHLTERSAGWSANKWVDEIESDLRKQLNEANEDLHPATGSVISTYNPTFMKFIKAYVKIFLELIPTEKARLELEKLNLSS